MKFVDIQRKYFFLTRERRVASLVAIVTSTKQRYSETLLKGLIDFEYTEWTVKFGKLS